jgi:helicase
MRLIEVLKAVGPRGLDSLRLVALVQVLSESDGGYTPMMKRGRAEYVRADQAASRYGHDVVRVLQRNAADDWEYLARCKRAAILADWVDGAPAETIERDFTTNPYQGAVSLGDVVKFADATRFHLQSAHQIAALLFLNGVPSGESIDEMLGRLQVGVPAVLLGLLKIRFNFTRGELLRLRALGTTSIEGLWSVPASTLAGVLGPTRTKLLEEHRPPRVSNGASTERPE